MWALANTGWGLGIRRLMGRFTRSRECRSVLGGGPLGLANVQVKEFELLLMIDSSCDPSVTGCAWRLSKSFVGMKFCCTNAGQIEKASSLHRVLQSVHGNFCLY